MLEATQITHNWMAHHAKQQNSATSQATSSAVGGSERNSQLSGKCLR